jgi:uncharacterized protein YebE (UPF0316 family)
MEIFKQILANPWYASVVIFITQVLMLYLRTINIIYTTKDNIFGAIWSNNGVSITWLLSMTIGLNSMLSGQWQPIIAFLLGGSIGTYWAIKRDKKNKL